MHCVHFDADRRAQLAGPQIQDPTAQGIAAWIFDHGRTQVARRGQLLGELHDVELLLDAQIHRRVEQRFIGAPIIRDGDGLALSSRNAYLNARERLIAPGLHRALEAAAAALRAGMDVAKVEAEAIQSVLGAGFDAVDYIEVRSPDRLTRLGPGAQDGAARILAAARLGRTRLLDNIQV